MMTLKLLRQAMRELASPERAAGALRFFKTGPGEYGEGDQFLGLTVPQVRELVRRTDALSEADVLGCLHSKWHEERLLALLVLVRRFDTARKNEATREHLVELYLANTRWINNWDLVDTSAPQILGTWLLTHDRSVLMKLAASKSLWEQRISVLATQAFIRAGLFEDTLLLCQRFLSHPHDLMHKACGWMLREVGKRDLAPLRAFLTQHAGNMPRTMLRYSLEKLEPGERKKWMSS